MNALARLHAEGFRVRIGPAGKLQAAPASRLTPELSELIKRNADDIRAALGVHRCWHVTLVDGTRLAAVRPAGCTHAAILESCRDQFGADRVVTVEAHG
ncbi:MAG: hypothetical protein IPO66_16275 [Rhodanobacteraceae bacterium]|nr:hypothetical protein [Rhodanobacteraceae bacterium]